MTSEARAKSLACLGKTWAMLSGRRFGTKRDQ